MSRLVQFELFLDDIPMWGYVGEHEHEDLILGHMKNSRHFLYTHLHFSIAHNDGHVIAVNVSTDPTQRFDITDAMEASKIPVEFTYSVQWTATDVTYEHRGELLAEVRVRMRRRRVVDTAGASPSCVAWLTLTDASSACVLVGLLVCLCSRTSCRRHSRSIGSLLSTRLSWLSCSRRSWQSSCCASSRTTSRSE
jgi:hypothetical protein